MTPKDRGKREDIVRTNATVPHLVGAGSAGDVVEQLVESQIRTERESARATKVTPSERRRRERQLPVTFSVGNEDVPDRIRELALQWGLYGPDGRRPSPSAVVEYLLLPQLAAAEEGEIAPPSGSQMLDTWT